MAEYIDIANLLTVGVALGGWFVVHRLTAWRDRVNYKRKMQTDFLVKAFQGLSGAANCPPTSGGQHFRDMERAIADIQLFGSRAQIELVEKFMHEFEETKRASLDPLLNSLRKDLRKELGYEQITSNVWWFRPEGGETVAQHSAPE